MPHRALNFFRNLPLVLFLNEKLSLIIKFLFFYKYLNYTWKITLKYSQHITDA